MQQVLEAVGEVRIAAPGDAHARLRGLHEKEAVPSHAQIAEKDQAARGEPKEAQHQVPLLPVQVLDRV